MNDSIEGSASIKAPWWFWLTSILALLWYLMDLSAFVMRVFMLDDMLVGMPQDQQNLYRIMPVWVNIVFAAEVFGGLFGSLALLVNKSWAFHLFLISFAGVLCQTTYLYFLSESIAVMGTPAAVMPLVAIAISIILILLAKYRVNFNQ